MGSVFSLSQLSFGSSFKFKVGYLLKDPAFSRNLAVQNHANAGDTVEYDLEGQLDAFSSARTATKTTPRYDAIYGARP